MPLGQIPPEKWSEIIRGLKCISRLPAIGLLIVATGLFSWLGFWFIVRLCMYLYDNYLDSAW